MLAWGEHPTRVHGQPGDDDMSSHGMACAGRKRCSRIELLEEVELRWRRWLGRTSERLRGGLDKG
jgi:hypothetical protein